MDDDTDFTFCQVGIRGDDDCLQSPETIPNIIIPNISGITLEDDDIDGMTIHKVSDSIKDDSSHISGTSEDLGANGSPASTNIDTLQTSAKMNESLKQKGEREAAVLLGHLQENKPVVKKNVVRAKVPFEKGYSPMDWLKLTRTDPDLAGLKGQPNRRPVSLDEVRQHKTGGSIWTVLKGRVYNISPYMKFHPGGEEMLVKAAGRDCTALFNKYHAWVNAEFLLEKCLVGILDSS